ncbi:unnamed protein product [Rhizoctonia solani]|uniref:Uncharacterized protein n=1 Tax=Rhizoctonia solani TaxID=456999 RepID=A0A8H3DZA4_9AGAM|nr:unnamed protein product [Rhizoctonia solani]CAE7083138.1 unnamed protein product [Rhizoctonia solani]
MLRSGIPIRNGEAVGDDILLVIGALLGQAGRSSILSKALGKGTLQATISEKCEEIAEAMREIENKKSKLKALEGHAGNLLHIIPGYVEAHLSRTIDICGRLNAIAKIWGVIRTDAQALSIHLQDIQGSEDEDEFDSVVQERKQIIPLYHKLERVLYSYANAVAK